MDSHISHYEIVVASGEIVIKRFKYRHGERMGEDKRFRRVFQSDQIEHARDLLRHAGYRPVPKGPNDPESWIREEYD